MDFTVHIIGNYMTRQAQNLLADCLRARFEDVHVTRTKSYAWDNTTLTPLQLRGRCEEEKIKEAADHETDLIIESDICILCTPAGGSSHWKAGEAAGQGKRVILFTGPGTRPELMYARAEDVCVSVEEVLDAVNTEILYRLGIAGELLAHHGAAVPQLEGDQQ